MFDWFKKNKDSDEVITFPEAKEVPTMPYVEPPAVPEQPPQTFYRLGLTDNNRVSFAMGYSEITMNAAGIDNMIKLLETYRDLLQEESSLESNWLDVKFSICYNYSTMKLVIKVPRKTRQHYALFCPDTPFKPKRVELKTGYKRKPKHPQREE